MVLAADAEGDHAGHYQRGTTEVERENPAAGLRHQPVQPVIGRVTKGSAPKKDRLATVLNDSK